MKKTALIFALLVGGLMIISSCKKKDDDPALVALTETNIVGKWKTTAIEVPMVKINGKAATKEQLEEIIDDYGFDFNSLDACEKDDITEFKADKTVIGSEGATKCDPADNDVTYTRKWNITDNGKKITIIDAFFTENLSVNSFTGNVLKLSGIEEGLLNGEKVEIEFIYTLNRL